MKKCELTDLSDFVCEACLVQSRVASERAVYGWSCRNMRRGIGCEGEDMSTHSAFSLEMGVGSRKAD